MAVFAIPVALLAIIFVRSGFVEIVPALTTFGAALLLATIAIVLAAAAFVVIWREGNQGLGAALSALFIAAAMLGYPGYLAVRGYQLPAINDITTDPIDPPRFEVVGRLRSRDANPVAYAGLHAAELQRKAYPSIEPLNLSVSPKQAYDAALQVIKKRKWLVVDERPPQPRREGRIEAVARTPILGFRDDVVVRVRVVTDGARVDIRSASRYGRHDFGTNASRIRRLMEDIDDSASGDETPAVPAPKPAKPTPGKGSQPTAKR
jgi:uncharacterized protein (DUF1499 family)